MEDWLSEVKPELETVFNESPIFIVGVENETDSYYISMTLTDQKGYYEMYIVVEHENKETAKEIIKSVQEKIAISGWKDRPVLSGGDDKFEEVVVRTSEEKISNL